MPSKTEEYLALAQRTANGLTRYWESWTDYLTTASRLYKYPFADQLMIYAQRPDATACAEVDIWNNRMNRRVPVKGISGRIIGIPDAITSFDVSDTGVRRNSRDPEMWLQKYLKPRVQNVDKYGCGVLRTADPRKAAYPDYRKARNEMQELVRAQKNVERFFAEEKEHHRENTDTLKKSPRSFPSWEASSADFLVYRAVLRSNAPVTRIFSPRSFRVLRQAGVCTKGSGIYTVHRQHKRLPGSFFSTIPAMYRPMRAGSMPFCSSCSI